jgi:hypothetical protein
LKKYFTSFHFDETVDLKSTSEDLMIKTISTMMICVLAFQTYLFAQEKPEVGRDAAAKYFEGEQKTRKAEDSYPEYSRQSSGDHFLLLGLSKFTDSKAWSWGGRGKEESVGDYSLGVTYKVDQWSDSMDWALRIDFTEFKPRDKRATQLSFSGLLTFPQAESRFPLYFGGGIGAGVFFTQLDSESSLAMTYQLLLGARFFDVYKNIGFFIETGLKNHLQVSSDGQFNGTYITLGAAFTF